MVAFCELLVSEYEKNSCLIYDEQGKEKNIYMKIGIVFMMCWFSFSIVYMNNNHVVLMCFTLISYDNMIMVSLAGERICLARTFSNILLQKNVYDKMSRVICIIYLFIISHRKHRWSFVILSEFSSFEDRLSLS